jgi:protein-S-isoprenylcysteine O-methyltransferase Ste14
MWARAGGALFWAVLYGWLASLLVERIVVARGNRGGAVEDRGTQAVLIVSVWAGIAGAIAAAWRLPDLRLPGSPWIGTASGFALVVGGTLFRAWAIRTLGRSFRFVVTVPEDRRVVDRGPYRLLRHPAYAGTLVTCLGIGVMLWNAASLLLALVVPLAGHARRIAVEEAVLRRELGERYAAYAARTWRLVPGVW